MLRLYSTIATTTISACGISARVATKNLPCQSATSKIPIGQQGSRCCNYSASSPSNSFARTSPSNPSSFLFLKQPPPQPNHYHRNSYFHFHRFKQQCWNWKTGFATVTLVGCAWQMVSPNLAWKTQCQSTMVMEPESATSTTTTTTTTTVVVKVPKKSTRPTSWWNQLMRGFKILRRICQLMLALSPVIAFYPITYLFALAEDDDNDDMEKMSTTSKSKTTTNTSSSSSSALTSIESARDAHEIALASLEQPMEIPPGPLGWYFRMCLHCVEWSGAAAIKIMQWAGSRPDMFGQAFCSVFSQLQDDTTPHAWKHTEAALREAYGEDWKDHIRLDEIIGSGCIAQVYKGVVLDKDGKEQRVAVKVMHPNVQDDIDADLDIMRLTAYLLERIPVDVMRGLKWMNLPGFVEEMDTMLKIQLDLRTEADHLCRFNENFKNHKTVVFPKLVEGYPPTKDVLIETFCDGQPIMEFIRKNTADKKLLTKMCEGAIEAVCRMIFLDNFVHGDLHPGNVMITDDLKFVLLDVGIVVENSDDDHRLISNVLASFIRHDGRSAGRYMIDDSNSRMLAQGDHAVDEERFIDKIEYIAKRASGKEYMMENLGTYITYICNAAATHHVMLNQAFVSAALAVKVQEGMALALDPSVQIWRIATPIILESERRNGMAVKRAKEILGGGGGVLDWLGGKKVENEGAAKPPC